MKYLLIIFCFLALSCDGPNNAASNRISTAPMSRNPTEVMPEVGQQPARSNRVEPRTGTAPTNEQLPDSGTTPSPGTDSSAHR